MAQNYEPESQPTDGLYQTLPYGLRHAKTGEHPHTFAFSCIDNDLLNEQIKKQVDYCRTISIFESKLHLIDYILTNYGFFKKVYVLQREFRYLNIGNQEKLTRKAKLISCVSNLFNGMYIVRAMNEDTRRKNYIPIYIFIDCAVSIEHFDNFYFSARPQRAFIMYCELENKNTKIKETFQCHFCDNFFSIFEKV